MLLGTDGHEVSRRIRAALGSRAGFDTDLLKPASYAGLIRMPAGAAGGKS